MEWDSNERDAWVTDAQRWIGQINGVLQCKIDLDPEGEVSGVHVVAGMEREPRHLVRDVESLLKARLGLDVFYKKIGVVQVVENGSALEAAPAAPEAEPEAAEPAPEATTAQVATAVADPPEPESAHAPEPARPSVAESAPDPAPSAAAAPAVLVAEDYAPRVQCAGVGVMASERVVRAEVQLRAGGVEARGVQEGPNHCGGDVTLVAEAALAALGALITEPVLLHLKEIRVESFGGQSVVMVAVDVVEGRRSETLFGSCAAGYNRQQAIVFAVLDALNRRLAMYSVRADVADAADA